ncbi:MAG: TetR/AcrR family transcriptional regulator [Oscillospiraceae bacterium]|nr:TetR/AcrR family transcriptional regulator [Oscillospiraceae bacterium]
MANYKLGRNHERFRQRILFVAAKDFLDRGYTNTTIREIAAECGLSSGSVTNIFGSKEDILCGLVELVIQRQFDVTDLLMKNAPAEARDDKILYYAAETVLQLHITELNENLRELYCMAYSQRKTSALLQESIAGRMEGVFKEHLPNLETKDFYKLEIASGGIMRGFMVVPCSMWFTMEEKVEAFLETALCIYRVPEEKIQQAVAFAKSVDFRRVAQETVDGIVRFLDEKQHEIMSLRELTKGESA